MRLGEIYIELKLDDRKYQESLKKQKQAAVEAVRAIESVNSSMVANQRKQSDEYNKFITENDKLTKKMWQERIKTQDKAAAFSMQAGRDQYQRETKDAENVLAHKKAMNQQQLKEAQNYWNNVDKINNQITKAHEENNKKIQKIEQDKIATQDKAAAAIMKSRQEAYQREQKNLQEFTNVWEKVKTAQQKFLRDETLAWKENARIDKTRSTGSLAEQTREEKMRYDSLTRGIESARREYNLSLGPQKTFLQNTVAISKQVLMAAPGFAIATAAISGFYVALRGVYSQISLGLKANEEYKVSVASMAALITTFSKRAQGGDISGAFREAVPYAEALIKKLETLDAKTIATGTELKIIAETMLQSGVIMEINNKKQEEGFIALASALKILTAGQNQDVQLRQESRALLDGQVRDQNRLISLLKKVDPEIQKHLDTWIKTDKVLENMRGVLFGFLPAVDYLQETWSSIGSTLETIHRVILREGFKPVYEDLLKLTKEINAYFIDDEGRLTKNAEIIQHNIQKAWGAIVVSVEFIGRALTTDINPSLKVFAMLVGKIVEGLSYIAIIMTEIKNSDFSINPIEKMFSSETGSFVASVGDFLSAASSRSAGPEAMAKYEKAKENLGPNALNFFEMMFGMSPDEAITSTDNEVKGIIDRVMTRVDEFRSKYGYSPSTEDSKTPKKPELNLNRPSDISKEMLKGYKEMFRWVGETREKWTDLNTFLLPSHLKQVAEVKKKYLDLNDIIFDALATGIISAEEAERTQTQLFTDMEGAIRAINYEELRDAIKEVRENWGQITNVFLTEHEEKIASIRKKYLDLNDIIFDALAVGEISPEEAERRQNIIGSAEKNEIRDLNNQRQQEELDLIKSINDEYKITMSLDEDRMSSIISTQDQYQKLRESVIALYDAERITIEGMDEMWDKIDKIEQEKLAKIDSLGDKIKGSLEDKMVEAATNITNIFEGLKETLSFILDEIAKEIARKLFVQKAADAVSGWIDKAVDVVIGAATGSYTAAPIDSVPLDMGDFSLPSLRANQEDQNNTREKKPEPQRVVVNYNINAINTQDGLQFLGKHAEDLEAILNGRYRKNAKQGVSR